MEKKKRQLLYKQTIVGTVLALVIAVLILLNLFTQVLKIVHYNGDGMEPGLSNGQILVILKTQKVEQGDVIAFYYNNQILVRRIMCEGGSQISIGDDGVVTVDNQIIEENYVENLSKGQCNITFPYYVQPGDVFVMGDNREIAMDSRLEEIGTIPESRIIGKIIVAF